MKHCLHQILGICIVLATTTISFAGNVPQYKYSRGSSAYVEFTGGTSVYVTWENSCAVFNDAEGTITRDAFMGEGFPIGFDFKIGGKMADQFAVGNYGVLYFGKGAVDFKGAGSNAFANLDENTMYAGMVPIALGIRSGKIRILTSGEPGNRVCTVQFKDMVLNENGNSAKYSMQLRMYEKDNVFEIAFKETGHPTSGVAGFHAGIRGWGTDDTVLLSGSGMDAQDVGRSAKTSGNMLEEDTYIKWVTGSTGYPQATYSLVPDNRTEAPANTPSRLAVKEYVDVNDRGTKRLALAISCVRAEGADATVILYSKEPFTATDLPVDGETFPSGTTFGNATVLYYGNGEEVNASILPCEYSTTYHIAAVAANGTPAFNRASYATLQYATTQMPPYRLEPTPQGDKEIKLEWTSDFPVIIAATGELDAGDEGYTGKFGMPDAGAAAGDVLAGGGKIVYAGDGTECAFACEANQMVYFRAWTLKDGAVSVSGTDAHAAPEPSLPYEPGGEYYPQGIPLSGWYTADEREGTAGILPGFYPTVRDYGKEPCLRAVSGNESVVTLATPALPLTAATRLTFEFALETLKATGGGSTTGPSVILPEGYEPGRFGDGMLMVSAGEPGKEKRVKEINTYGGTMVSNGEEGHYNTGSSTFEKVTVEIPAKTATSRIRFDLMATEFSILYLRGIRVELADAVGTQKDGMEGNRAADIAYAKDGAVHILPAKDGRIDIYGIDGKRVATVTVRAGAETAVKLPAGTYIAGGNKVFVRP